MDMLDGEQIAASHLSDWRKLAQGLHARFLVDDFAAAARFVTAIGDAAETVSHQPIVTIAAGCVDLKLVSDDAVYRAGDEEHVVQWATQHDVDLARRISDIAAEHGLVPQPEAVSHIELGLDTRDSGAIAPFWAALLTGDPAAQGRGTPEDEIRDATGRVPNLWFGDLDAEDPGADAETEPRTAPEQRCHIEVYVAPEVAEARLAACLAAGGTVVDDRNAPMLTVVADPDGNTGVLCVDTSAAG